MARRKSATKGSSKKKSINKSEFVRGLPASMAAKDVVAKAKAAGIELTDKHVYAIRSKDKSDAAKGAKKKAAGAPKAAAKRGRPRGGGATKADFVRSLPATTPAKEVVARAKQAGISVTPAYVYNVRATTKPAGTGKRRGRPPGSGAAASAGSAGEATFRRLVLTLGIETSKRLLSDVESRLQTLIAGG